ncbi:hypothetical protein GQ43DRAFT_454516 [Delitschia confertaspora ATCC 74209]|uniref:Uncharacterized protein n=1 Tax=Delitschia confertaspora ATCC 74209 TaxID=1513339 RepID=A0A9P4JQI5_9PLEO|nr:hypothetical protein GQ43DRAFT_454516 [Delitschia confertaspora ATCC 74209]
MVFDLLTLAAIPAALGTAEGVHQQHLFDDEAGAESESRLTPFYLDVYCDAKSRKRDEVHGAVVVLRDEKLYLWPKDPLTNVPTSLPHSQLPPHPFTGFYLPFPTSSLPQSIPTSHLLGLVSTIPPSPSPQVADSSSTSTSNSPKPKLHWIYADTRTLELKYGPRAVAREHVVGPWDWTGDEEGAGLTLCGEESLVVVEEETGGLGWAVYWDREDDGLKGMGVGRERRVLRCSLERRVVGEGGGGVE